MEEKKPHSDAVKNIFQSGCMPTKAEYTRLWIDLINKIEREKASQSDT